MSVSLVKSPERSKPLLRLLPYPADRAFLPSALEIIETPPSPTRTALMLTICAFVVAAVAWSWFGRIDIIATARGKIEPAGHVKVVEPLQNGTVTEIRVTDGQQVKAGDVLLVLDGREDEAGRAAAEQAFRAAQAEALRREAEITAVRTGTLAAPHAIKWPADIPQAIRNRENAVLVADLAELSATLANLDAQEREKAAAVLQLDMSLAADNALIPTLTDRVRLRQTLVNEGNGSRLTLLDAEQSALQNQVQIAGDTGRRIMAQAAITSLQTERQRTLAAFLADDERKLDDIRHTADQKQQEEAQAAARLARMTLTAPIDGIVQALSVTNAGQVVTTGQEVMRLVPTTGPLEIQAYVTNDDIGFVSPGQTAEVKIDSFPFARFGTIGATVTSLAYDAIPADAADRVIIDAARQDDPASHTFAPNAKAMSDLVFAARLTPARLTMNVDGHKALLAVGMTVSVEIRTGKRRILSYLFSPLVDVASNALGER